MENKVLFWHRRDLRLDDNHGLYKALTSGGSVIPVFIFDTTILSKLKKDDQRVLFIHQELSRGVEELSLHIVLPLEIFHFSLINLRNQDGNEHLRMSFPSC